MITLEVTRSNEAVAHARELIRAGKVKESANWDGPSAQRENDLIEAQGWDALGKFYLGRETDALPDTKARFRYPYSDDFDTVSINGLRAIRSRAAANDEQEIFESAGVLLDEAKAKIAASDRTERRLTLAAIIGNVDRDRGILRDVVIIEAGEARGHRMMISGRTLDSAVRLLEGATLPAYISHDGAFRDRLLTEVGFFSGFYRDGDRIRAATFQALPSFRDSEPERFGRLFDLADLMPKTFGISIVFEGALQWETPEGLEEFEGFDTRPDEALFGYPTITPTRITSADFVDTPAATSSLFSEPAPDNGAKDKDAMNANTEPIPNEPEIAVDEAVALNESASAELEKRRAENDGDENAAAPAAEEAAPAPKKKATKKKKLEADPDEKEGEEQAEEEAAPEPVEAKLSEVAELEKQRDERDKLISTQAEKIAELEAAIAVLKKVFSGADEVEDLEQDAPEMSAAEAKAAAINNYLQANPSHNRMTAVLQIAKKQPELFGAN